MLPYMGVATKAQKEFLATESLYLSPLGEPSWRAPDLRHPRLIAGKMFQAKTRYQSGAASALRSNVRRLDTLDKLLVGLSNLGGLIIIEEWKEGVTATAGYWCHFVQ